MNDSSTITAAAAPPGAPAPTCPNSCACGERLSPAELGLPAGGRRRTPGLRREEVAALAGVGLAWYTWFEQGRNISVSAGFLDNLARVLKLDAAERRHLYLLAHQRPPAEPGRSCAPCRRSCAG